MSLGVNPYLGPLGVCAAGFLRTYFFVFRISTVVLDAGASAVAIGTARVECTGIDEPISADFGRFSYVSVRQIGCPEAHST